MSKLRVGSRDTPRIKITRVPSLDQSDIQYLSPANSEHSNCTIAETNCTIAETNCTIAETNKDTKDTKSAIKQKKKYFVFRSLELTSENLDGIDEISIQGPVARILEGNKVDQ